MTSFLSSNEPAPASIIHPEGRSPIVLICEHASNLIPSSLGTLGLKDEDLQRHIAYDIGAAGTARALSSLLDAPLILQNYSRLVYDCNRAPEQPGAMPEKSEVFDVPGNKGLNTEQRLARTQSIYRPFVRAIDDFLDVRAARHERAVPVSIHSFTPVYFGKQRTVELGLLWEHHEAVARHLLKCFPGIDTQLNEPYGPQHGVMHLMNLVAAPRGLPHIMIEIRNDLIVAETQQQDWAQRLAEPLKQAAQKQ